MKNRVVGSQCREPAQVYMEGRKPVQGLELQFYFHSGVLEMKNRVVGASVGLYGGLGASARLYGGLGASAGPGVACKVS